jgi:circadian clock protein KaiC
MKKGDGEDRKIKISVAKKVKVIPSAKKVISLTKERIEHNKTQILEQRKIIKKVIENSKEKEKKGKEIKTYFKTGVSGFDSLIEKGIPQGHSILIAGGAGSGKTIFCLQILEYQASLGKKCFYMSFEESEERLAQHMKDFGWDAEKLIKQGNLKIQRMNPFDISRSVDAMLAKQKGELLIEVDPILLPKGFNPDFIVVDSLTSIASTFIGKSENYRIYIEQLFRFFEKIGATSFLITETTQIPEIFSTTGVEEFLADGVVVFYNLKRGNVREKGLEVLKLRGAEHQKRIVAMAIEKGVGIKVYPQQEIFGKV